MLLSLYDHNSFGVSYRPPVVMQVRVPDAALRDVPEGGPGRVRPVHGPASHHPAAADPLHREPEGD